MKATPEEIAARFRLRLHLAPKGCPSARVTDNRAQYHLRRSDTLTGRTPLRQPPAWLLSARRALILDSIITWGAVAAVVWWLWLR